MEYHKYNSLRAMIQDAILTQDEFTKDTLMIMHGIKLPTPQRTGTLTQQREYARYEAGRIMDKLGHKPDSIF
jgi:hypothetical protein